MSYRNRCVIYGANGSIDLTIPLVGGRNQRSIMKDVRILNEERWQLNHWRSIFSAYNRSPFFDHYRDELERLYERRFDFLVDWNLACFEWILDKMSIGVKGSFTDAYRRDYDPALYADRRNRLKPATIQQTYPDPPRYTQVFSDRLGFVPYLSILDYLFCVGKINLSEP